MSQSTEQSSLLRTDSSPRVNDDTSTTTCDALENNTDESTVDIENDFDDTRNKTSNLQSMMHLIKGNIGTGILAIPSAIKNAGLAVGSVGILVIGAIAIHAMHMLVNSSHVLCRRTGARSLDYGGVVFEAFRTGPSRFQRLAKPMFIILQIFLCITQLGFCTIYILFIAQNIQQVVYSSTNTHLNVIIYQSAVFILLIPYVMVRNLRVLAPFSMFANVLTAIGLVIIIQWSVRDLQPVTSYPAFSSWSQIPLYFGTAIYAFEGIGVVLPIENHMRTPSAFAGYNGVLNTGMVITTVLYFTLGFYGYLRVGDDIQGSITLNLPNDQWLYLLVRLAFALSMFITYGLQFYVPLNIIWSPLKDLVRWPPYKKYGEVMLRVFLLIITFLLSISVPHLDLMIALVGALSSSAVALIFPPIVDLIIRAETSDYGRLKWIVIKDVAILIFAVIGFITGTSVTIKEIVNVL